MMTIEQAERVCMPFGKYKGWCLQSIAEQAPIAFCKLVRRRRKFYGDIREALDVMFNSAAHTAAKEVKQLNETKRKNREMLERARY